MQIISNYSLANHNSFKIDAKTKYFVKISSENDLLELIQNDIWKTNRKIILGWGNNTLWADDFDGLVVWNQILWKQITEDNDTIDIQIGAGEDRSKFVERSVKSNLAWLENLTDIPSSIWASVVQNIWAYWVEAWNLVKSVEAIDMSDGKKYNLTQSECKFGYRDSIFKSNSNLFVISVTYKLQNLQKKLKYEINMWYKDIQNYFSDQQTSKITIQILHDAISKIRASKLPDLSKYGTAWSFFKNPIINVWEYESLKTKYPDLVGNGYEDKIKLSAWQLIDLTVWKWYRLWNVWTYANHALVLVNHGLATGTEVFNFQQLIKDKVKQKYNIQLEEEVIICK